MPLESVDRIISKTTNWPLTKRREYLISALKCEKGRWRRNKLSTALRQITTKVLRGEKS